MRNFFACIQTDGRTDEQANINGLIDSASHADYLFMYIFYRGFDVSFWLLHTSRQTRELPKKFEENPNDINEAIKPQSLA